MFRKKGEKRNIKQKKKKYKGYETKDKVESYQTNNTRSFKHPEGRNTQQYRTHFLSELVEYNALDNETVHAGSADALKTHLKRNSKRPEECPAV